MGVSINGGTPIAGWFIMEHPMKNGCSLGVPPWLRKPPNTFNAIQTSWKHFSAPWTAAVNCRPRWVPSGPWNWPSPQCVARPRNGDTMAFFGKIYSKPWLFTIIYMGFLQIFPSSNPLILGVGIIHSPATVLQKVANFLHASHFAMGYTWTPLGTLLRLATSPGRQFGSGKRESPERTCSVWVSPKFWSPENIRKNCWWFRLCLDTWCQCCIVQYGSIWSETQQNTVSPWNPKKINTRFNQFPSRGRDCFTSILQVK